MALPWDTKTVPRKNILNRVYELTEGKGQLNLPFQGEGYPMSPVTRGDAIGLK